MLQRLSEQIHTCLGRAAAAEQQADTSDDPMLKAEFSEIAKTWRHLAESYEFVESLQRFLLEAGKGKISGSADP